MSRCGLGKYDARKLETEVAVVRESVHWRGKEGTQGKNRTLALRDGHTQREKGEKKACGRWVGDSPGNEQQGWRLSRPVAVCCMVPGWNP